MDTIRHIGHTRPIRTAREAWPPSPMVVLQIANRMLARSTHSLWMESRVASIWSRLHPATPMPVVVYFHGKGGAANRGCSSRTEITKAAESMGFALLCGDAYENWQFPRIDGVEGVSSANSHPCTSADTPEVDYLQKIFDTLAA